jgi:hypothetical protein
MSAPRDFRATADRLRAANAMFSPSSTAKQPPVERGERLATIPRGDSEELRIVWDQYEGKPYLSLRVWTKDAAGGWWPDKAKGVTIRRRELAAFADGFAVALDRAEAQDAA